MASRSLAQTGLLWLLLVSVVVCNSSAVPQRDHVNEEDDNIMVHDLSEAGGELDSSAEQDLPSGLNGTGTGSIIQNRKQKPNCISPNKDADLNSLCCSGDFEEDTETCNCSTDQCNEQSDCCPKYKCDTKSYRCVQSKKQQKG